MSFVSISTVGLEAIAITKLKANMQEFLFIIEKFQMGGLFYGELLIKTCSPLFISFNSCQSTLDLMTLTLVSVITESKKQVSHIITCIPNI